MSFNDRFHDIEKEISKKFPNHFGLFTEFFELFDKFIGEIESKKDAQNSPTKAAYMNFFVRIHGGLQGAVVLAQSGFAFQACVLTRVLWEDCIQLVYLVTGTESDAIAKGRRYIDYEGARRGFLLAKNEVAKGKIEADKKLEFENYLRDFRLKYTDGDLKSWSGIDFRTMACEAGISEVYETYYRFFSGFAHDSPESWHAFLENTETGFGYHLNPNQKIILTPLLANLDVAISTLGAGCRLFGIESLNEEIGRIRQKADQIVKSSSLE